MIGCDNMEMGRDVIIGIHADEDISQFHESWHALRIVHHTDYRKQKVHCVDFSIHPTLAPGQPAFLPPPRAAAVLDPAEHRLPQLSCAPAGEYVG